MCNVARCCLVFLTITATLSTRSQCCPAAQQIADVLPGTDRLDISGDLSALMRAGFDAFLTREIDASVDRRQRHWNRDFSNRSQYEQSVSANRDRLRRMLGAVDTRIPITDLELVGTLQVAPQLARSKSYTVTAVRAPVLPGVHAE